MHGMMPIEDDTGMKIAIAVGNKDVVYGRLSFLLLVALVIITLWTFRDYGISWDEPFQNDYGNQVLRYYTSGFKDKSALSSDLNLQYYGGFFEVLAALCSRFLPFPIYDTWHLISAFVGLFGIIGSWKLVQLLAGPGAAFWAAVLLSSYPSYYGHMFMNSKDIPFAAGYVWALYYLIDFVGRFPDVNTKIGIRVGLAIGFCTAIRVGGLVLVCYLWVWTVSYFCILSFRRTKIVAPGATPKRVFLMLFLITVISYAVMLVFWPYALSKPLIRPFTALAEFSSYYKTPTPPDYVLRYFAIKLPEIDIFMIACAVYLAGKRLGGKSAARPSPQMFQYAVLIFAVAFPVGYVIARRVNFYDEVRHLLFVVPPICCLAGIMLYRILEWTGQRRWRNVFAYSVLAIYFLYHFALMIQLHPYEYIYYNALIGGVSGADRNGYETDYWVTGYREGIKQLQEYLYRRDGPEFEHRRYRILVSSAAHVAQYYLPKNFVQVDTSRDAEIYFATTRARADREYGGRTIVTVARFGTPFVVAKLLTE